ncbi:CheW-like domain-containing protein [Gammaproteobacteria bacterium]
MGSIDWNVIHGRLAKVTATISGEVCLSPGEVQKVLETRASAIVQLSDPLELGEKLEVLEFQLSGESYAIESKYVYEVCKLKDLTFLPNTPSFIAGVINLRGRVLAIVDIRKLFEFPSKGLTELNQVIVLSERGNEFGILADSILGVRSLSFSSLQEKLPTLTGIRAQFLKGVTGQMSTILDGGRLLEDSSLKVDDSQQ